MKSISWNEADKLSDSEITYLLYLEGKDMKTISKIRNMDKNAIESDIIKCKIKFRAFEGSQNTKEILKKLMRSGKDERMIHLREMDDKQISKIEDYIINNLFECNRDECSFYIWVLGEIRSKNAVPSLVTYLKCTDGNIKRLCCSALGKIQDLRAEDELINCIDDTKLQVRQYAIKALGRLKSKKALSLLYNILEDKNQKEYIINSAKMSIEQIEENGDENE